MIPVPAGYYLIPRKTVDSGIVWSRQFGTGLPGQVEVFADPHEKCESLMTVIAFCDFKRIKTTP
jgi:hypothetical protein